MFDYPSTVTVPATSTRCSRCGRAVTCASVSPSTAADPQWLWRGVLDGMEPGYDAEQGDICTFTCIDAKGDGGRPQLAAVTTAVGAGETASARVTRILQRRVVAVVAPRHRTSQRSPSSPPRSAPAPSTSSTTPPRHRAAPCSAPSTASIAYRPATGRRPPPTPSPTARSPTTRTRCRPSSSPRTHPARDCTTPAGVTFTEDPAGSQLWDLDRRRRWRSPRTLSTPTCTSSPNHARRRCARSTGRCPSNGPTSPPASIMGRQGATPITVNDPSGIAALGVETYERTDLITATDADVTQHRQPHPRHPQLEAGAPHQGGHRRRRRRPRQPSTCSSPPPRTNRPASPASTASATAGVFSRLMLVVGVSHHDLAPTAGRARIALDDAGPYAAGIGGRWQTTGRWDQTTWMRPP